MVHFAGSFHHQLLAADCFSQTGCFHFHFFNCGSYEICNFTNQTDVFTHQTLLPWFSEESTVTSCTPNCVISPALHLHPSLSPPTPPPPPLSPPSLTIFTIHGQIITHQRTLPDGHIAAGLSCHSVFFGGGRGAGIHACNLSILEAVPTGAGGKSCLSGEGIAARDEQPCSWLPRGFFFFTKFDLRQNGLVDLCLFFQPLLLKTD